MILKKRIFLIFLFLNSIKLIANDPCPNNLPPMPWNIQPKTQQIWESMSHSQRSHVRFQLQNGNTRGVVQSFQSAAIQMSRPLVVVDPAKIWFANPLNPDKVESIRGCISKDSVRTLTHVGNGQYVVASGGNLDSLAASDGNHRTLAHALEGKPFRIVEGNKDSLQLFQSIWKQHSLGPNLDPTWRINLDTGRPPRVDIAPKINVAPRTPRPPSSPTPGRVGGTLAALEYGITGCTTYYEARNSGIDQTGAVSLSLLNANLSVSTFGIADLRRLALQPSENYAPMPGATPDQFGYYSYGDLEGRYSGLTGQKYHYGYNRTRDYYWTPTTATEVGSAMVDGTIDTLDGLNPLPLLDSIGDHLRDMMPSSPPSYQREWRYPYGTGNCLMSNFDR